MAVVAGAFLVGAAGIAVVRLRAECWGPNIVPTTPPVPMAGSARSWETQVQVSTYSAWNTRSGNLLTTIPIVSISGTGPDLSMALYHNSGAVASPYNLSQGSGIDLAPGWTTSYSSQIVLDDPVTPTMATVIADDGTPIVYTWDATWSYWHTPPGYQNWLEAIPDRGPGSVWTLTNKDMSKVEYSNDGDTVRLRKIVDPVGNESVVSYLLRLSGVVAIDEVRGAGRLLKFIYQPEPGTRLVKIQDPRDEAGLPQGDDIADRDWDFYYEAGRLRTVRGPSPMLREVTVTYDAGGRIGTLGDWHTPCPNPESGNGCQPYDAYSYQYDTWGYLSQVTDPAPHGTYGALTQHFYVSPASPTFAAFYTDRQGHTWTYQYCTAGGLYPQGNLTTLTNPLGESRFFAYDNLRNLTQASIGSSIWTYAYDGWNLVSATDPLGHVQHWTYDNWNNVTSFTDGVGNTVQFLYDLPDYPTLRTRIVEPADGQGNPAVATAFTYLTNGPARCASGPAGCGQLIEVRDPNDVRTRLEYDSWGQLAYYAEGELQDGSHSDVYFCSYTNDSGGRTTRHRCSAGVTGGSVAAADSSGGDQSYDANGDPKSSSCPPALAGAAGASGSSSLAAPAGFPSLPCNPPVPSAPCAQFCDPQYSPKRELLNMQLDLGCVLGNCGSSTRTRNLEMTYDELGRVTRRTVDSNEYDGYGIAREFNYDYSNWGIGELTRMGPDGVETFLRFDAAGRPSFVRRGPEGAAIMSASYTYAPVTGLLQTVTYGNGATVNYEYDVAQLLSAIEHKNAGGVRILRMAYSYTANDLVAGITESDAFGGLGATAFGYDNRGRLISEARTGSPSSSANYNLRYEYDQGGNRKKKTEYLAFSVRNETMYEYDLDYPGTYVTANNRLMKETVERVSPFAQQESMTSGGGLPPYEGGIQEGEVLGDPNSLSFTPDGGSQTAVLVLETRTLLSTKYYLYNDDGNVTRVVTNLANDQGVPTTSFSAARMDYAVNQQAVAYVIGETWVEGGSCPTYNITYAREFRYDEARSRYMDREIDPVALKNTGQIVALGTTWTDYDGDQPYGDFTALGTPPVVANVRSYDLGMGSFAWTGGSPDTTTVVYDHRDMIGTLRAKSQGATGSADPLYTAFGERLPLHQTFENNPRFGYAGAHGYQASTFTTGGGFPFLHVGHRYYDPASGRFLQRDPIGIRGGKNVYQYAGASPAGGVDPTGLWTFGFGFGFSLNLGFINIQGEVSVQIGYNPEDGLHSDLTATGGGGGGLGLGASCGVLLTLTDAHSTEDLNGTSTEVGIDTPVGSGSLIQGWPSNPDRPGSGYSGVQIGIGPSIGGGIKAGDTHTVGGG